MAERPPTLLGVPASPTGGLPTPLLRTGISVVGAVTTVDVRGEIDMDTAHQITSAVEDGLLARPRILILDLRAVTFCDCAGLRSLLRARQRVTNAGATFHLGPASATVRRILDITGAAAALELQPDIPLPRTGSAPPATVAASAHG
ncbi:STAS domain-containing protein [Kitasatospora sp. NBC_00315]|uniref:STAS domain-containing protein n=1 Tax=Kitasatospora sp. NBC_00315 TaxID=2975963 RepID=UPI00324364E1